MNFVANNNVEQRRNLGLECELQSFRNVPPHPSRGGSRGYSVAMQASELQLDDIGLETTASRSSLYRWRQEHFLPYKQTGNKENETIVGLDLYLMCMFLIAYPEATADEITVFIANNSPGGIIYTRSQIYKRLADLKISRKVGSTEANQAFTPMNMFKREIFWNQPQPWGIHGVPRRLLIDIDECGIELKRANRKYGYGVNEMRVVIPGLYSQDTKVTIILAIEAGDPRPEKY